MGKIRKSSVGGAGDEEKQLADTVDRKIKYRF
jgi:hypothetical protein